MFLVDYHHAKVTERQEDGRTCSEDNVVWLVGELFLPYLYALGIRIFGMVDAKSVAEDTMKALGNLHGEGNLWKEIENLLAFVDGTLYHLDIDLCLSA